MRTNYVFIDYENVQPGTMTVLEQEHFKVIVFVGANQSKVSFEVASALQRMGTKASYIKISGNGSNALDFHIAYYIGKIAALEPDAYFHIISKDAGFDPLIAHLKDGQVFACRSKEVTDIPIIKMANSKTTSEKHDVVVANLRQRGSSRPRTLKTLSSTINSLFQKSLPEEELDLLLRGLQEQGVVSISGAKVSYALQLLGE